MYQLTFNCWKLPYLSANWLHDGNFETTVYSQRDCITTKGSTNSVFVLPHTNSYSRPITYLESAMRFRTLYSPCKVAKIQVCLLLARVSIHSCVPCEVLLVQKLPQQTGNCIIVCYHRFFFLSQPSVENYSVT